MSSPRAPSYWTEFPETYRAEHVAEITKWIALGESGVVVGGSGAGKSNLVGFLVSRHDVLCSHLPNNEEDYAFIHMDVNSLPSVTTAFFYRAMLLGLQNTARRIDASLVNEINEAASVLINLEDTLGLHFVLQQAHEILVANAGKHVVWLIDRFDEACVRLDPATLNSLRNLRDAPGVKGKLSYIMFTRHPLARLRNPREYDELHEILVPNTCWVGPMVARDARLIADQMAERHGVTFGEEAVDLLLELSGKLPAFMKAASTALAAGRLAPGEPSYVWLDEILADQSVLRNCQEMWDDLKPEEQNTLSAVAAGAPESDLDALAVDYLIESNLVVRRAQEAGGAALRIFSPIFELFVIRQRLTIAAGISLDPVSGALTLDDRVLRTKLTPPEHRLLAILIEHKDEICQEAMLIAHVWPDDARDNGARGDGASGGETAHETLAATVQQLREKVELDPTRGVHIQHVDGQGYRLLDAAQTPDMHITINEDRFQEQVQKIVESDFFRGLEHRARQMRQEREEQT